MFVLSWGWKKRQLSVVCTDEAVGHVGEPQVTWLGPGPFRLLSCKRCPQLHSRDAKKRPKQVALVSKHALLHNFLFAAVYEARPRTLCF